MQETLALVLLRRRVEESMWGKPKTLVLAAVVVSAALVPLFGDPRVTPVTHPLWARMLLRSMEMTQAVRTSSEASQVFSTLAWRDSLSYPADQYLRADGAVVEEQAGQTVVVPAAGPAEVVYALAVAQPGDYQLRARLAGAPGTPASAEVVPLAGGTPLKTFTLNPANTPEWVFGGSAHLDPGAYGASVLLPPGCTLSRVEVAPPCLNPIEPAGGWQPTGVTTGLDLAMTALKALDMEYELPPDTTPIEIPSAAFQVEAPPEAVEAWAAADTRAEQSLRASRKGLRASVSFDIPETGLYSISGFVNPGTGQRWLVDGCRKAIVCPSDRVGWRPILSQSFSAGRHTLLVSLGNAATLDQIRIEKKKDSAEDYVATLRRLGLEPGPNGPVSQDKAIEAMRFVREQRQEAMARLCGDTVTVDELPLPPLQVAEMPGPSEPAPPVVPLPPPIAPPILPPQEPASPTTPTGGGS
ncbi:MAG: hypothetical protein LJF15_19795 [Acidobacteria bacterium]|jgi:hypothetical protein|nr:hypothetical protein [Acidobacteriota bacterium]